MLLAANTYHTIGLVLAPPLLQLGFMFAPKSHMEKGSYFFLLQDDTNNNDHYLLIDTMINNCFGYITS